MNQDQSLREHLLYLLQGGGAHASFEEIIADFPSAAVHRRVTAIPYTPWQVLEHMRIAQWDILEFSRDARHVSPPWPAGYWPESAAATPAEGAWERSLAAFRADLRAMEDLISDPSADLYAPLPHGDGQTLLREALLVADHNAYHLGVLATLKRLLAEETAGEVGGA